jgi:hypothetical protein
MQLFFGYLSCCLGDDRPPAFRHLPVILDLLSLEAHDVEIDSPAKPLKGEAWGGACQRSILGPCICRLYTISGTPTRLNSSHTFSA